MDQENLNNETELTESEKKTVNDLIKYAKENQKEKLKETMDSIPIDSIVRLLSIAMVNSYKIDDELYALERENVLKRLENVCPRKDLEKIRFNALKDYTENNNKNVKHLAKKNRSTTFIELVKSLFENNNIPGFVRALKIAPEGTLKKIILDFAKGKNTEALNLLNDECGTVIFQETCREAITNFVLNNNTDLNPLLPFSSVDTVTSVMIDFINKGNKEALQKLKSICNADLLDMIPRKALQNFVLDDGNFTLRDIAKDCSVTRFAMVLKECIIINGEKQIALQKLVMTCPDEKIKDVFSKVMNEYAADKKAIKLLKEACPDHQLDVIIEEALIEYATTQDHEKMKKIAKIALLSTEDDIALDDLNYRDPITLAFNALIREKNGEGVDRLIDLIPIETLQKTSKKALTKYAKNSKIDLPALAKAADINTFAEVLMSFAKENNKSAINKLIKHACPDHLKIKTVQEAINNFKEIGENFNEWTMLLRTVRANLKQKENTNNEETQADESLRSLSISELGTTRANNEKRTSMRGENSKIKPPTKQGKKSRGKKM